MGWESIKLMGRKFGYRGGGIGKLTSLLGLIMYRQRADIGLMGRASFNVIARAAAR